MGVPTFQAIVVVDIESFGSRTNPFQEALRRDMTDVIGEALSTAGIDGQAVDRVGTGDGMILIVPPAVSAATLAGAFVRALDAALGHKATMASEALRMRLRVSLHQGHLQRDATGWMGEALNTACRLVDAQPLRDVLRAAPEARMALIVSDEVYRGVVRHDYPLIDAASFGPAVLSVKELHDEKVWISVPGRPSPPGLNGGGRTAQAPPPPTRAADRAGPAAGNFAYRVGGDQVYGIKVVNERAAGRDD
ncbi:hypothetical protein [Actinoplanes sp. URMC 104]|uniref:hypothetical protein n=1 Tax=Actinoplanes sp. URMC 104 TaxID=3423409 RepID=UPI003F1D7AB6